jgi:RNA polymerase sigma-70 factor (ECF subfamily)
MNFCGVSRNVTVHGPKSSKVADDFLITAAQGGEEWAFVELCSRNSARAFHLILRVTRNREDAEDALQDSILKAFRNLQQFDRRSSFATWFTRIGINSALMILRKQRIRQETSFEAAEDGESWDPWQIADHSPNPEQCFLKHQSARHLRRAIGGLPPTLRTIVESGPMEGRSMKEIAHNMGITVPAAKSRLARAKAALRTSMR